MHRIEDVIVQRGKVELNGLPFADGQRVTIVVSEAPSTPERLTITDVRRLLKGGVERFDRPFEPVLSNEDRVL